MKIEIFPEYCFIIRRLYQIFSFCNKYKVSPENFNFHLPGEPNLLHLLRYRPLAVNDYSYTSCNLHLKQIRLVKYPGYRLLAARPIPAPIKLVPITRLIHLPTEARENMETIFCPPRA